MKKLTGIFAALMMVVFISSCDKDEKIAIDQLPSAAQVFLDEHFASQPVVSLRKDKDGRSGLEYEARLDSGIEITFDQDGSWQEADAPDNVALPTSFILPSIVNYVAAEYPNIGINNIDREVQGFDVELTNNVDLIFDTQGNFVRIDR